MFGKQIVVSYL